MTVQKLLIIGVAALLICALWVGCSEDTANFGTGTSVSSSGVGLYFPLHEGYSTTYSVKHSNGDNETVRYEAGREVDLNGSPVIEWKSITSSGAISTSYFKLTETTIDHITDVNESPQRILELPFTFGHTWTGLVSVDDGYWDTEDSVSIDTTYDKGAVDTTDGDNDGPLFSYPATSSTYLTVVGFEGLELSNNTYFSSALKISSSDRYGNVSYFWYVGGVGLAKYVIDATGADYPEGSEVGELVRYGY